MTSNLQFTKEELLKLFVAMSNVWDMHHTTPELQPTEEFVQLMQKIRNELIS